MGTGIIVCGLNGCGKSTLGKALRNIRIQRVRNRSFQRFGERMLLGGDLYEQEEKFFDFVESRPENTVEKWVKSIKYPVLRIDGTKPIEENVDFIMEQIKI